MHCRGSISNRSTDDVTLVYSYTTKTLRSPQVCPSQAIDHAKDPAVTFIVTSKKRRFIWASLGSNGRGSQRLSSMLASIEQSNFTSGERSISKIPSAGYKHMCQDVTPGLVFLRLFTLRIVDFYFAASELLFAPEAFAESQSLRLLMGNTLALKF